MEIKSTINIILKDLEEARALIDDLRSYPGVPLLQVELAKAKCRSAEDVIKLLSDLPDNYFTSLDSGASRQAAVEKTDEEEIIIENETEKPVDTGKDITFEEEVNHPVVNSVDEVTEKISRVVDEIVHDRINYPPETPKTKGKKIVADNFSPPSDSINEKIGDSKKEGLKHGNLSKPVTDLVKSIGINDRFLFIREIFEGNQETYNAVIGRLNNVKSMDEALSIINSSGSDSNEEAYGLLIDLVKRKISNTSNG